MPSASPIEDCLSTCASRHAIESNQNRITSSAGTRSKTMRDIRDYRARARVWIARVEHHVLVEIPHRDPPRTLSQAWERAAETTHMLIAASGFGRSLTSLSTRDDERVTIHVDRTSRLFSLPHGQTPHHLSSSSLNPLFL